MLYGAQPALLWLTIEAELAVVCASVPALRKFFIQVKRKMATGKTTADTTGEMGEKGGKAKQIDALPAAERKAGVQTLGPVNITIDTEASAGSEESIVRYERPPKIVKGRVVGQGANFYEEETIDEP
jgi:hypothetical protein